MRTAATSQFSSSAVQKFSIDLHAGDIMALVGDNGAGKSMVVKIIVGMYSPTSGSVILNGKPVDFTDASDARQHGIKVVYQDLALADSQPVYMNLFLGRELMHGPLRALDRKLMAEQTLKLIDELDVRLPSVHAKIRDHSVGQRQGGAIARARHGATKLVVMDEPTAAPRSGRNREGRGDHQRT